MITSSMLVEPDIMNIVNYEGAAIVPGIEMKWRAVEQQRGQRRFGPADAIVAFARSRRMALRGHTAMWHQSVPTWAFPDLDAGSSGFALALDYLSDVIGRYRGQIAEWDVVNEAIEPSNGRPDALRTSRLLAAGGTSFIADSFYAAREADPQALLFYNDYGTEYDTPDSLARRRAILDLLSQLQGERAPVHGFGVQAHLKVGNRFIESSWRDFISEIAAMGLQISVTELDVDDSRLPSDINVRDCAVADHARRFLDVTLDETAVRTVMTWGLSDKYSWLSGLPKRADGLLPRGLPYDDMMRPKPLRAALVRAFDHAPDRHTISAVP